MLAIWIATAFFLGLLARQLKLPPLVGFLAAGFLLNAFGVERTPLLDEIAHLGVLLLLFTVGLKLRFKTLLRAEVWGVGSLQFVIVLALVQWLLRTMTDFPLGAILAVASVFSFSSTVLAAKILEQKREMRAFHGRVAIGILIVQDVIAVAILGAYGASHLDWPAALVLLLPLLKMPLEKLLSLTGHGELLVLLGAVLALGIGGYGFEAIGLSSELGALLTGMLLASHPRAVELSASLWGMKEFFLVGFFLTVGLTEAPNWSTFGLALIPLVLIPVKVMLYFLLLLAFRLSARTAFLAGLSLATYSEFGLIVMAAAAKYGMVENAWVVATAICIALSFAIAAPLNRYAHDIYAALEHWLRIFERRTRHPDDEPVSLGKAEVAVVGMGRVGTGAYNHMREIGKKVVGLDSDLGKVERHLREGRRVVYADAEDPLLWHRLRLDAIQIIILALPDREAKILASERLRKRGFQGLISATYVWPEERELILAAGADVAYNYFAEAGVGMANDTFAALAPDGKPRPDIRPGTHRS